MADKFVWKDPRDICKGVGIYHITFVVSGRKRLLGGSWRSGNIGDLVPQIHVVGFFVAEVWYRDRSNYHSLTEWSCSVCNGGLLLR